MATALTSENVRDVVRIDARCSHDRAAHDAKCTTIWIARTLCVQAELTQPFYSSADWR